MARLMKNSGIQWIGDIPKHWEISKVKKGFYRKNSKAHQENPVILSLARDGIKIRDISNNEGQLAESYYNYNPVDIGDLLINPMDLYSGANCNISYIKGVISPAYINLKALDGFISRYYNYYFKLQYWSMTFFAYGKGVSFENRWTLSAETLMNYFIPIPPIEEQQRIANYLDEKCSKIDETIEKEKAIIEKLKEYKQSLITETVTKGLNPNVPLKDSGIDWIGSIPQHWNCVKLKHLTSMISKGTTPSTVGKDIVDEGEILFIKAENIQNNKLILNPLFYIDKDTHNILSRSKLKFNDILFVIAGATIGKVAIFEKNTQANTNQAISFIRLLNNSNVHYVWYYLQSNYMKEYINISAVQSAQPNLSMEDLGNFTLSYPPMEEQEEISKYLDEKCNAIDNAITQRETLIDKLTEYKKSLIYECVTGKKEV